MQSRVGSFSSLEEGQISLRIMHQYSKHLPLRLLLLFLLVGVGVVFLYISMYTYRYINIHSVVSPTASRIQAHNSCVHGIGGLESWIRPPSSLLHKMNDNELFWRASMVPMIEKYPFRRTPKIAFMFLTRGPLPLAPLWERFFKGNEKLYSIYIHSAPSYVPDFPPSSPFYRRQIPSQVLSSASLPLSLMRLFIWLKSLLHEFLLEIYGVLLA